MNKKLFFGIIVFLIVGILALAAYLLFAPGNGALEVFVLPSDAKYTISGKSYEGSQTIKLKSGTYKIKFERNLFISQEVEVKVIKEKQEKVEAVLDLRPDINKIYDTLSPNEKDIVDGFQQQYASYEGDKLVEYNPIVGELPYVADDFRVDYGFYNSQDPYDITLEITIFRESLNGNNEADIKRSALSWLKENGINTDNAKIKWYRSSKNKFN